MYQVFNMGHRLEVYTNEETSKHILDLAQAFELPAQLIGRVEIAPPKATRGQITITSPEGPITYLA